MLPSFSRDPRPLFWFYGRPIRAVTLLLSFYLIATIGVSLLLAAGQRNVVQLFMYHGAAVAQGEIWRLLTYSFVNVPSLWFGLEMVMFYYFGKVVEAAIGSKKFFVFYGGMILLQGLSFQVAQWVGYPSEVQGTGMISMGLFAAFTAIYPGATFFFGIPARWMLLLLLGFSGLQLLAEHQWMLMGQLVILSCVAVFWMKKEGYREALYFFSSMKLGGFKGYKKPAVLPPPEMHEGDRHFTGSTVVASLPVEDAVVSKNRVTPEHEKENKREISMTYVDQLLDKINRTGLSSLTAQEKEKLEAARLALLKRDNAL